MSKWPEPPAAGNDAAQGSRHPLSTTGSKPPDPGRRLVPDLPWKRWQADQALSEYNAIDDAVHVRELKVYNRHTQANAILFIDYVIKSFPLCIREVRTDSEHEFQAKFHWHAEGRGLRNAYIKPRILQVNGRVERSHRTDEEEFYQLLNYKDDVDF